MAVDIRRILADYNTDHITEGHKHCTSGWTNVHCPFCPGSRSYHLGLQEQGLGAHCWRCGKHSVTDALVAVLGIPRHKVRGIMRKYSKGIIPKRRNREEQQDAKVRIHPLKLPNPHNPLTERYKKYLAGRGFDPEKLEQEWGLQETGPVSILDGISYSHRILIPIYWQGEMVSFQARDISGRSALKYLACPKRREKIHHKNILYGDMQQCSKNSRLVVVEGVTDVWRLGTGAVATFGIEFKRAQVKQLAKAHSNFIILFDGEPIAQAQARKLGVALAALGKTVQLETVEGDPAELNEQDAKVLMAELAGR